MRPRHQTPATSRRPQADPTPYSGLTPAVILDAVEAAGWRTDGSLLVLNSFENRVYQVGIEDGPPLIAKFYRPSRWTDAQILEEHTFTVELADAEIPAVAPLPCGETRLLRHAGFRFALFPRQGGRAPEFDRAGTLAWMGRFLGRLHAVGRRQPFHVRPRIDRQTFGIEAQDTLMRLGCIPAELAPAWISVVDQALAGVADCETRAGQVRVQRLHGDCHAGNILWTDHGPHFVDFDDCRMGPAVQDLWMLLSGDEDEMRRQFAEVLEGYERFASFDPAELALVEALRTLRLIHYAAWIAARWKDPAFPAAFPWFAETRYWQDRILELREQIALMAEPPRLL